MEINDPIDARFLYVIEAIFGADRISDVRGGEGSYVVSLDYKYTDVGTAQGDALFAAGFIIAGAHYGDDEEDICTYSIRTIEQMEDQSHDPLQAYYGLLDESRSPTQ